MTRERTLAEYREAMAIDPNASFYTGASMRLTITDPRAVLPVVVERDIQPSEVYLIEKTLDYGARQLEERRRGEGLAANIAAGQCAIVGGWCLLHNLADDPGHAYSTGRVGTLD